MADPWNPRTRLACFLMAVACISGCKSQPEAIYFPTIPGQFADEGVIEPLVALEAFIGETAFYVRYQDADGTVYSGGEWAQRIQLEEMEAGETYAGPYILPLQYRQREPWTDPPAERQTGTILGSDDWQVFRDQ